MPSHDGVRERSLAPISFDLCKANSYSSRDGEIESAIRMSREQGAGRRVDPDSLIPFLRQPADDAADSAGEAGASREHERGAATRREPILIERPQSRMIGLQEFWGPLRRRMRLIVAIVLACTVIAAAVVDNLQRVYTAQAALVLERTDTRPFALESDLQNQVRDSSATETEMEVIMSRQFLGRIVDELQLVNDPQYNTYLVKRPSLLERAREVIARYLAPIDSYLPIKLFGASDTPKAPQLPSAKKQRDRTISTLLANLTVTRKGESLAVSVSVASIDPEQAAAIANRIADTYVQTSLEFKRDVRAAGRERARATSGAVAFLRERVTQPLLMTLREEEARLLRERAELSATYGKDHPKIQNSDAEIGSVRTMIDEEIQRILLDLEEEAAKPSARVVSVAAIPTEPSFPKPKLIIASAFLGSAVLAIMLAILLEAADTRIRTGEQTSQLIRLPNLAYVPRIPGRVLNKPNPVLYIRRRPRSSFAEAMRSLYLTCRPTGLARGNHDVLMMTSCVPDEGKTTISLGLAVTAVNDGRKTLLVDLDLHQCGISRTLELSRSDHTLESYLSRHCNLDQVIQTTPDVLGLDVIAGTSPSGKSGVFLQSDRLRELIKEVRLLYDFVILDTPPVLVVDDANWLSSLVDGAVLVVRWGRTREDELWEAASRLRLNHAPLIGTVINMVEPKIQTSHGYGGTFKYRQHARHYVTD